MVVTVNYLRIRPFDTAGCVDSSNRTDSKIFLEAFQLQWVSSA
jgi:hypothetical protein